METETYKELLLKYLTGKIDETGTSPQELVNLDRKVMNVNIKDSITAKLQNENNATTMYILGKIYSNQYENFIIYGNYNTDANQYGYICVVNRKLEIVSLLTQYKSGTLIYPLVSIRQSETGQFYGLTYGTNGNDTDFRIALFNNVISSGALDGNYNVDLRQTYIVPNSSMYRGTLYRQNRIIKSLDSAVYYIVLHNTNNVTVFIKFTINVGSENTWEVFETEYLMDTVQFDILLDKSSGEEIFYFYGIDIMSNNNYDIYRSYQLQDIVTPLNTINLSGPTSTFLTQVFATEKDNVYISTGINQVTTLYKVNGTSLVNLYSFTWASSHSSYLYLEDINGTIFYKMKNTNNNGANITVGLLINDQLQFYDTESTSDTTNSNYDYNDFYIFMQYNLVSIYIPYIGNSGSGTYLLVSDYNPNNYNGLPYENVNSILPVKGRILTRYDMTTDPVVAYVYARNLYNKYIRENITVCTLEIPNTLLNEDPIFYIGLLGATNDYLFTNVATLTGKDITKNIYETLDINFYNTITMTDDNNATPVINQEGATRINQSTSALLDYHNVQATKARLNFTDGTYNVITIDPATQITITGMDAEYNFIVYVPNNKSVTNLEIISYDELTVYATVTGTFAVGAFNQITQTVSVF